MKKSLNDTHFAAKLSFSPYPLRLPVVSASAITAELAKKCEVLMAKQFPPRSPGNPAEGSAQGSAQQQLAFFEKCVDNNGNVSAGKSK